MLAASVQDEATAVVYDGKPHRVTEHLKKEKIMFGKTKDAADEHCRECSVHRLMGAPHPPSLACLRVPLTPLWSCCSFAGSHVQDCGGRVPVGEEGGSAAKVSRRQNAPRLRDPELAHSRRASSRGQHPQQE